MPQYLGAVLTALDQWFTAEIPPHEGVLVRHLSRNLKVAPRVQNLSDRRPPYLQIPAADLAVGQGAIPFDGANASPVGRLISLQITKGW